MSFVTQPGLLALFWRTLFGFAKFEGRSRRKEVIGWWLGGALIILVAAMVAGVFLPRSAVAPTVIILSLIVAVPSVALFVRRLHDQDRTGWFALIMVVSAMIGIGETIYAVSALGIEFEDALRFKSSPWPERIIGLIVTVLHLLPGNSGPNRFGEDPRT